MSEFIDLSKVKIETNSNLWKVKKFGDDTTIQITGNTNVDHVGGKVALIDGIRHNYRMQAELKFLGHHLDREKAGWFGFAIRAQDLRNYELIWFMPNAESGKTVAYLTVAHSIVPWWTEGYENQTKGKVTIPSGSWFKARVEVVGDEVEAYVEAKHVFTKKLTYYLSQGKPGFYVGTATDAAFRRILIEDLPKPD